MEENKLTAREIFVQLTVLQNQLTENSQTSLHHLSDAIASLGEEESDSRAEQVSQVCNVFDTRETTMLKLLHLYEKMYNDVVNEGARKVELVKSAFDHNMALINDSDLVSEDKAAALGAVTEKISAFVDRALFSDQN